MKKTAKYLNRLVLGAGLALSIVACDKPITTEEPDDPIKTNPKDSVKIDNPNDTTPVKPTSKTVLFSEVEMPTAASVSALSKQAGTKDIQLKTPKEDGGFPNTDADKMSEFVPQIVGLGNIQKTVKASPVGSKTMHPADSALLVDNGWRLFPGTKIIHPAKQIEQRDTVFTYEYMKGFNAKLNPLKQVELDSMPEIRYVIIELIKLDYINERYMGNITPIIMGYFERSKKTRAGQENELNYVQIYRDDFEKLTGVGFRINTETCRILER